MILEAARRTSPQFTLSRSARKLDTIDFLALLILAILDGHKWLRRHWPRVEIYALSRYDLARRRLDSFPPAHWSVGWAFVSAVAFFLWLDLASNVALTLIERGVSACLA